MQPGAYRGGPAHTQYVVQTYVKCHTTCNMDRTAYADSEAPDPSAQFDQELHHLQLVKQNHVPHLSVQLTYGIKAYLP